MNNRAVGWTLPTGLSLFETIIWWAVPTLRSGRSFVVIETVEQEIPAGQDVEILNLHATASKQKATLLN
jgi:hypothetical protein